MRPPASAMSRELDAMGMAWRAAILASCSRRLIRNPSWLTNRASAGSRARLAKAALISWLVPALRICSCSLMAWAAASTSRVVTFHAGGVARIDQHGYPCRSRHQLAQDLKPLGSQLGVEKENAGRVAARPSEAR